MSYLQELQSRNAHRKSAFAIPSLFNVVDKSAKYKLNLFFYKRSNHEESFCAEKINHKNLVK